MDISNCSAPCWNSIVPGRTTKLDAVSQLENLSIIDRSSILDNEVDDRRSNVWAKFANDVKELNVRIHFVDDTSIATVFDVRNTLSMSSMIAMVGTPDYVFAKVGCADTQWITVGLLQLTSGTYVEYFDNSVSASKSVADTGGRRVLKAPFFDPEMLDEILENYIILDPSDTPQSFRSNLQTWNGYGEVSVSGGCD